ncbi:hypothetical protein ACA910_005733 [Epithemia clementina (nom. ined.)]
MLTTDKEYIDKIVPPIQFHLDDVGFIDGCNTLDEGKDSFSDQASSSSGSLPSSQSDDSDNILEDTDTDDYATGHRIHRTTPSCISTPCINLTERSNQNTSQTSFMLYEDSKPPATTATSSMNANITDTNVRIFGLSAGFSVILFYLLTVYPFYCITSPVK